MFHVKQVLKLTVSPDGTVQQVTDASGTLQNAALKSCVLERVKKWRFPATKDGKKAIVALSLILKVP